MQEKKPQCEQKDLTVIIPVYNCEKYLANSINSVLSQDNIDIVLVNDGSTDSSPKICDTYAEEYTNVFVIHKANGGVSSARNLALEYILQQKEQGYVTFLDADDYWYPNFFDDSVRHVIECGYSLIGFQSSICNCDCSMRRELISLDEGLHLEENKNVYMHAAQHFGAMLYSIELIRAFNLEFPLVRYCEDRSFSMQCIYLADSIYLMNKLMYAYRQNPTSAVHNRPWGMPHYLPIIDTWRQTDAKLRFFANEQRKICQEGNILARLYILDMIDEHFRLWKSTNEIDYFFKTHSDYAELLQSNIGPQVLTHRYRSMITNPALYRTKQRIIGICLYLLRKIKRLDIVQKIINRQKYPINNP